MEFKVADSIYFHPPKEENVFELEFDEQDHSSANKRARDWAKTTNWESRVLYYGRTTGILCSRHERIVVLSARLADVVLVEQSVLEK